MLLHTAIFLKKHPHSLNKSEANKQTNKQQIPYEIFIKIPIKEIFKSDIQQRSLQNAPLLQKLTKQACQSLRKENKPVILDTRFLFDPELARRFLENIFQEKSEFNISEIVQNQPRSWDKTAHESTNEVQRIMSPWHTFAASIINAMYNGDVHRKLIEEIPRDNGSRLIVKNHCNTDLRWHVDEVYMVAVVTIFGPSTLFTKQLKNTSIYRGVEPPTNKTYSVPQGHTLLFYGLSGKDKSLYHSSPNVEHFRFAGVEFKF